MSKGRVKEEVLKSDESSERIVFGDNAKIFH
jgi:hypothetical protein